MIEFILARIESCPIMNWLIKFLLKLGEVYWRMILSKDAPQKRIVESL